MSDDLVVAARIAASGLGAQSARMRVVAQNLANAQSTGAAPGADPYQRQTVSFAQELDAATGASVVRVAAVGRDLTPFRVEHMPGHVAADEKGMVKLPNVNALREMADMREANRSYEANLQVVQQVRKMRAGLIDLLRGQYWPIQLPSWAPFAAPRKSMRRFPPPVVSRCRRSTSHLKRRWPRR